MSWQWPVKDSEALTAAVSGLEACWHSHFGEGLHYPHHSIASGQTTGRNIAHPSAENWIKDLLKMDLPTRARHSFPHSQSLPSGNFHKPLMIMPHQMADRMKTRMKAECQRVSTFELWCWRVPWTAKRSNQSFLNKINPEYSLEGLMLKLKLQYFSTWCENWLIGKDPDAGSLKAGGEGEDRGQDGWMASLTQWTWVWASSRRWWRTEKPGMLLSMVSKRVDTTVWMNNNRTQQASPL